MIRSHDFFKERIKILRKHFSLFKVDGFLVDNVIDIFYFTGMQFSQGILFVTRREVVLCVDGRYIEMAKKSSPFPVRSIQEDVLKKIWTSPKWEEAITIGFDKEISFAKYKKFKTFFCSLQRKFKPCNDPIQKQRAIKDREELSNLKKSVALLWKGFLYVKKFLKVGITEKKVALFFEWYCKKNGADDLAFKPIVAFGENSAFPHHHSGDRKLKNGDLVLVDIGVVVNGYMSDITRVIFFGEVPKKIKVLSHIVKEAYEKVLLHTRPGVEVGTLERIARTAMGEQERFFLHSLGHGIGLSVHEYPLISTKSKNVQLEEGMVITIEPGLYLPGVGGVRHENMVVITKSGYHNLLPKST